MCKEEQIDRLGVGSLGVGTSQGVMRGSVSQKIAHTAPCPVMIMK
jgi:nucleotide-binding universal stress UspA family protein